MTTNEQPDSRGTAPGPMSRMAVLNELAALGMYRWFVCCVSLTRNVMALVVGALIGATWAAPGSLQQSMAMLWREGFWIADTILSGWAVAGLLTYVVTALNTRTASTSTKEK